MTALAPADRATLVPPGIWEVDAKRSTVCFEVRHLKLLHIRGCFHGFAGVISSDSQGIASIVGSVDVDSIDTGDRRRDARLCTEDFFDAEHHPVLSFEGASPPGDATDAATVRGTMSIRGVTQPLELRTERSRASVDEVRIRAYGAVSRREFALDWDPAFAAGGLVIDDRVALALDVVLARRDRAS